MSSPPTATPYDQSVAKLLVQKLGLNPGKSMAILYFMSKGGDI